jgi:hypothetical protein
MSIFVDQNISALLELPNFFPADTGQPFTVAVFVKASNLSKSGFYDRSIFGIYNTAETTNLRLGMYHDSGTGEGIATNVNGRFDSININPDMEDQWRPLVIAWGGSNFILYARNAAGVVQTRNVNVATSQLYRKAKFFENVQNIPLRVAHLTAYQQKLTQTEVVEFMDTAQVAAYTPYSKWSATADWGGGTITDSGSSGQNLTPPAAWVYSADNPTIAATGPDYNQRKGSTFTATHTLGTVPDSVTINGLAATFSSATTTTVSVTLDAAITTSGEYNLVIADSVAVTTQTQTVQLNVFGVVPSNNPAQKDGAALASLTGIQIRITAGANLNGTEVYYSPTETTDASGNFSTLDVSTSAAAAADPVRMQVLTAAGDSITSAETVGLI